MLTRVQHRHAPVLSSGGSFECEGERGLQLNTVTMPMEGNMGSQRASRNRSIYSAHPFAARLGGQGTGSTSSPMHSCKYARASVSPLNLMATYVAPCFPHEIQDTRPLDMLRR